MEETREPVLPLPLPRLLNVEEVHDQLPLFSDETLLESGQLIRHHARVHCDGLCCLHGTSPYEACRMPRVWANEKHLIEHVCPCGNRHPCLAGLERILSEADYLEGAAHICCDEGGHCTLWLEVEQDAAPDAAAQQEAGERMAKWMNSVTDALKGFGAWAEAHRDAHGSLDKLLDRREARLHERMDKLRNEMVVAGSIAAVLTVVACLCLIAIFT